MAGLDEALVGSNGFVPKARYTSAEFATLERDRLWSRVWQIACREEELAAPGRFVEYTVGDDTIAITRTEQGMHAFHNACLHRGRALVAGCGVLDDKQLRCPYHGWCYALDGTLVHVPDREEFRGLPDGLALHPVQVDTWGGFVFVNFDSSAEPLHEFLAPLPELLAPYHLDQMRLRSRLSTIIEANWKAVVDAFNEGYHVQGLHPQILPWTDDVSIAYEQFDRHAHYGRLPGARRELRPSPRVATDDFDEGEILAGLVAGLGGAFLAEERAAVDELRASGPPPGMSLLGAYQGRRRAILEARGFDTSGLVDELMTSAEDVYWFPNVVGPIYPASAILFRVRPYGSDPNRSIKDTWVLEWRPPGDATPTPPERFFADWHDRNWGEITEQDYANLAEVQRGMRSSAWEGARLNPRQEGNILHMHRVIDRYLMGSEAQHGGQ
ncbi:MAG TPA: aromatic ring-hydroxylating dioxygenase subunit alpha [Acidimicrobiia bacterium]|nr:aromatic ring-hydroxylating dioxygenase subunit alpha [Acidimicrobiia bacterium]